MIQKILRTFNLHDRSSPDVGAVRCLTYPSILDLGNGTWAVLEDIVFEVDYTFDNVLPMGVQDWTETYTVPLGFVTDLASVPEWLPVKKLTRGTRWFILHDFFYQTTDLLDMPRCRSDEIMHVGCMSDGLHKFRSGIRYLGVRLGGWIPWNKYREEQGAGKA